MMDSDNIQIDNSSVDNNQTNHTPIAGEDYYYILGVNKDATERHISSAYKKLSLKYHPDRNEGDEETIQLYHLVTEAYSTLIDPLKRSEYDKKINNLSKEINEESHDNSYTNISIGKVFGNVLSKFKLSDNHSTIQSLIDTAINIAKDGSLESNGGPPINPRLVDLVFGWPSEGKTKYEYETALKKISTESDRVNDLSFIDKSTNAYDPNEDSLNQPKVQINLLNSLSAAAYATASSIRESVFVPSKDVHKNEVETDNNETSSIDNSKSSINILSNATKFSVVAATAAVDTASVATGWLRKRLSGFQSKQESDVVETPIDSTSLPNNTDTLTEDKKIADIDKNDETQSSVDVVVDQIVQESE
eukprot:gene18379-24077_t